MRVLLQNLLIFFIVLHMDYTYSIPISSLNLSSKSLFANVTSLGSFIRLSSTLNKHLLSNVAKIAYPSETRGHYCLHTIYLISIVYFALKYLWRNYRAPQISKFCFLTVVLESIWKVRNPIFSFAEQCLWLGKIENIFLFLESCCGSWYFSFGASLKTGYGRKYLWVPYQKSAIGQLCLQIVKYTFFQIRSKLSGFSLEVF